MKNASQWRYSLAQRLAEEYASFPDVNRVLIASSTARGHADKYSDLDVVVFWERAPTDIERSTAVAHSGGDLVSLYPFDPDWKCWSDMFTMGRAAADEPNTGLFLDITHYLVSDALDMLHAVTQEFTTDEPSHNLVSLLNYGQPLYGEKSIEAWKASIIYPHELASAMVMKYGQVDYFWRWKSALARGENLMLLYSNLTQHSQSLLRTLFALNHVYFFGFGWIDQLFASIQVAPNSFESRYRSMWKLAPPDLAGELSNLIEETYDLIEVHLPDTNVERLRSIFRFERRFWDETPPNI